MKRLAAYLGLAALCLGASANAQTLLTGPSLTASATATTTSSDYRYTRHTRSGGSGRGGGGRSVVYYSWDPHVDQATNVSLPMILNGSSGTATTAGTFYAPTYSASASATTSLSGTASGAVFTTTYNIGTTLNAPQVAHQRIVVTAQPGGDFSFTLADFADVRVTATGSANGYFHISGFGTLLAYLNGPGTFMLDTPLSPGSYWITSGLASTAVQDTQLNSLLGLGTTSDSYSFTVTFTQTAGDTGGDGGGGGD